MIVNNYVVLGVLFLFSIIIYLILCYLHKKLENIISEDPNWDANKAREESEIGLKREINEEIKIVQNSIRCATRKGEYYTSCLKPKEETIKYFKSKEYKVELIVGEVFKGVTINHYKISWENKE